MGGGVISFGLCVILICIPWKQNGVRGDPLPAPAKYDLCAYMRPHEHHHSSRTTTPAPADEKPKEEKKDKMSLMSNLLRDLMELEKEADKKKDEEKKKKEEDDKKKEEEEKKKKEDTKKDKPKGFQSMDEMWERYIDFFTALYYTF